MLIIVYDNNFRALLLKHFKLAINMQKSNLSWYLILIATFIIWGTQHPVLKILSDKIDPFLFNFLRYSIAGLALAPFILKNKISVEKRDLTRILFLGFFGIALFGILNFVGVKLSTATNNAILLNSWPLLAVFLAPLLIGEKITKKVVVATLIGFAGVVLIITQGKGIGIDNLLKSEFFLGNILILLSGLCLALYSIFSKRFIKKYGSLNITFYAIVAASITLLFLSILGQKLFLINQISLNSAFLILWVALPTTALTYVIWFKSIDKIGLVKTNSFFFLIPASGILASTIFLNEKITYFTVLGTLLILSGIYTLQRN